MKISDLINLNTPPNIALVGEAGSGKTCLASQLGPGGYIFDFDDGLRSARNLQDKFTSLRHACEFDLYRDPDPTNPNAWVLAKKKLRELLSKPPRAICVDSITGVAQAVKLYVMFQATRDSFRTPEIQHWGMMTNEVDQFILLARACKCLTIFTAHVGLAELQNNVSTHIINSVTKSHGKNKISWLMDEVLYMKPRPLAANKFSYVVSGRSVDLPTRTRSGILEDLDVTELGLSGLLQKIGFSYDPGTSIQK